MAEKLDWYTQKKIRENLHPILHFRSKHSGSIGSRYSDFMIESEEIKKQAYIAGGYQKPDITEDELKALSTWLYGLEEGSFVNDYGLKFKYPSDALYYKLKWAVSEL